MKTITTFRIAGLEARIDRDRFEDGSPAFHGYCPALKGCHTWARTQKGALRRLRDAIVLYLEDCRSHPGRVEVAK